MLIGIDASRANKIRKTGTEWYAYSLIRHFAKIDKDNQYILYVDKPLSGGLLDLTDNFYDFNTDTKCNNDCGDGCCVVKSPHNNFRAKVLRWPFNFFWTQGRLSLEMLFSKPDVLFVPSHALPIIHPKRSIVTIHDIGFDKTFNVYKKENIGPDNKIVRKILNMISLIATFGKYRANTIDYLRWTTEYALQNAKKIITVSNFSKNEIISEYSADEKKIKVIHNGYNKDLYIKCDDQEAINCILKKYGIKKPYFLYIGRIEKKKNIAALIEAFAIMRENHNNMDLKLVLIGSAGFGFDEVNYMIREFAIDQDVIITGWVNESDLPSIYSQALAFVFPSIYEGFGIPLLQAMSCGTPVIASNISSIPEVLDGAGLLFDPKCVKSMAKAMSNVVDDKNLRNFLISKGKNRVKNFSWEKCAKETLQEIIAD